MTNSMQENNSENTIEKKVLNAIEKNQIKPHSKWYFVAQSSFFGIGLVVLALLVLFFSSLVIFNIRQSGSYMAPGFGFYGVGLFLLSLPWLLIGLVVILVLVLEYILKRYKFAYQRPILYSFVALALLVSVGSIFISQSKMHEALWAKSRREPGFFGGPMYKHFGKSKNGPVTIGKVFETNENGCKLNTEEGENWQVLINDDTHLPYNYTVSNGDVIIVLGPKEERTIKAVGIKPFMPKFMPK